jgi:hypothetical protein
MYHRRVNPEKQFINQVIELSDRIDAVETQPTGVVVVREQIKAIDENGVQTIFGVQPDGQVGIEPFVYDLEPPPIATMPFVSAEPGVFVISWDGALQASIPRDFVCVNIIGHKMSGATTVLSKPVGTIRNHLDISFVSTDVAAIGETWQFSLEAEDYRSNKAAWGPRSPTVTMLSAVSDDGVTAALAAIQQDVDDASLAASNAQSAAASASSDASAASAAALAASNLAASKGKVLAQTTAPTGVDQNSYTLWIDTTGGANTPKRWNAGNSTWMVVTDKVASDAAAAVVVAQAKADTAFNNAATAATAAGNAQTTADNKNKVWYLGTAPAGTAHKQNDIWFNTAADNRVSQWNATNNTWDTQLLGNSAILANLDAGKITVGTLLASVIGAKTVTMDKLVVTSTDNLVVEADFTNNGSSWELSANKTINATAGRGGGPAFRVTGTVATQTSLNKVNKISVNSEERFRVTFFVKSSAALAAGKVNLKAKAYTTPTVSTNITLVSNPVLVAGVWTNVGGISPVLDPAIIALEFFLEVTNPATGTVTDIDFIGVTRAADGRIVLDGSMDAKTITGSLIQSDNTPIDTAASRGIKLTTTGFKAYNPLGQKTVDISATTGNLTGTGTFSSINTPGGTLENTLSTRISMGIIDFPGGYNDAPGLAFEKYDPSSGITSPGGYMYYYNSSLILRYTVPYDNAVWSANRHAGFFWFTESSINMTAYNTGPTQGVSQPSARLASESTTSIGTSNKIKVSSRVAYIETETPVVGSKIAQVIANNDVDNANGNISMAHYTYNGTTYVASTFNELGYNYWRLGQYSGSDLKNQIRSFPDFSMEFFSSIKLTYYTPSFVVNTQEALMSRAEFSNSFSVAGGGASWDTGPAVLDTNTNKTKNNDFCQVGGLSGSINILKSGYYQISIWITPTSNPGLGWTRLNLSTGETLAQVGNNSQIWETYICTTFVYIAAGQYVRSVLSYGNPHDINVRWKIVRSPFA